MSELPTQFVDGLHKLPEYLSEHVLLTVISLAIGMTVSLPLAVAATRCPRIRWPLLTIASVNQTIPSIAMLALVYAIMLAIAGVWESMTGHRLPEISFVSTLIALTLYSMLPMMRNTVTGILGVDPSMIEAAQGMGMTSMQRLFKVELPLAAPVMLAGIRTATVWVVGIATLATPVGQTSLGDFIFTGLQLENWGSVLLGCLAAAALAIALDLLIALLQTAVERRSRLRGVIACTGLVLIVGGALAPTFQRDADYTIGAKTFDEQFILASLLRDQLTMQGMQADKQQGLGSTILFSALRANRVDAYVDYSGTIWAVQMGRQETSDSETVYQAVRAWLKDEHGITCLGRLGFENAYALVMQRARAQELGIQSIADLAAHAPHLTIGGDYEFFDRPEWQRIRDTYSLAFADERKFQSTFMYRAVQSGEVDIISAFSSDGRIAAYDLIVLDDPRNAIPPYDAVLLISPTASQDESFRMALEPLVNRIPDDVMRRANYMVDRDDDKKTPDEAAQWLREQIGLDD